MICETCGVGIRLPNQWEKEMDMCEKCIWEQFAPEIKQMFKEYKHIQQIEEQND